jgi:hypothetical protein
MIRTRLAQATGLVAAAAGGLLMAAAVGSAGTGSQPTSTTLGSTTGTPSTNVAGCSLSIVCTFVPFLGVSNPELQVPFGGTVTSFSVNAGSASGTVWLRVLRPAPGGHFTGVGTSQPETLGIGVSTFTVSLPVAAGDVLALDNNSSALMFDTASSTPITAYYELPSLADGQTAAPNHSQSGYRLLLSATVQAAVTTTTSTTSTALPPPLPVVSHLAQTHRRWREGSKLAKITAARKPPIGTVFSFALNVPARVTLSFVQQLPGRRVHGKCVAGNHAGHPVCKRSMKRGSLSFSGHVRTNSVSFDGRVSRTVKLPVGSYALVITAIDTTGASRPRGVSFTIAKP